jgi:hypothetical protein
MSIYWYIDRLNDGQIIRGAYLADSMPVVFAVDFPPEGTWTYAINAFGDGTEQVLECELLGMVIKL